MIRKQNDVLITEFDIMKKHLSKKFKCTLDNINWFAEIPATLSKTSYLNITTNYNSTSPSHPSHPSTGIVAKQNRVKLVCNPPSCFI